MASRYYYDGSLQPGSIELTTSEAHHLIHVKRAKLGQHVELFDGQGRAVEAEIIELKKRAAILRIDQQSADSVDSNENSKPGVEIVLASSVPKGDRFRWLIEKATEIGVTKFIPLVTDRAVVTPRDSKLEKHRQYVIEACKQSGRNQLMQIASLMSLEDLCQAQNSTTQMFVGHPRASCTSLADWQEAVKPSVATLLLVVGPEGGLTDQELDLLDQNNAVRVCCSPHILRTETAGIVMSTLAVSVVYQSQS